MRLRVERWLPVLAAAVIVLWTSPAAADLVNVAPLGTATQSTQNNGYAPERGIDGDLTNFTHTLNSDLAPTWEVDLGQVFPISQIVLHNRDSCCAERLRDITVWILDEGGDVVWQSDILNPLNELFSPEMLEIDLVDLEGDPVDGQTVRVTREPDPTGGTGLDDASVLSLGEVLVLVDNAALPVSILKQPEGGTAYIGACHVFTVELFNAEGAASISYQWLKDDIEIDGATDDQLILGDVQVDDAGMYTVKVTVDAEVLTSDAAELVVPGKNLAIGGTATQSSMGWGGVPERAIDGNTDGVYNDGSVIHTTDEAGAWWQVELFGDSTVDTVTIWGRTDCCWERLSNFRLSALDVDGGELWGEDFFTEPSNPDPTLGGFEVDLEGTEGVRTIRIERIGPDINGANFLNFAEVEVLGDGPSAPPDAHANLARGCGVTTSQSSTLGGYASNLAVDGNFDNFSHTLTGNNGLGPATWEIDLQQEYALAVIVLHNRTSCCGSRLRDITVSVLDASGDVVWESDLLNPENEMGAFPDGPPQLTINIAAEEGGPVTGQIVQVVREPDPDYSGGGDGTNTDESDVLSLGEVEIFEMPDCPPDGDTHCEGLTVEGPGGGYPGLYTATALGDDDDGDTILYTFTFDNGVDAPVVIGPQEENTAEAYLEGGDWTVTAALDDDPICGDESGDRSCTETVEVLDVENLATGGLATQSSEWGGALYPAELGIDGNFGNYTHTAEGNDGLGPATWEVELLAEQAIGRIVLYNRADCCGSRLRDITVSILDGGGDIVWESDLLNPENELGEFPLGPRLLTVDVEADEPGGVDGLVVRVTREPDDDLSGTAGQGNTAEPDVLSLGEVVVFPPSGAPPAGTRFKRGDANDDNVVNITDGIFVLNFLFLGGATPPCAEASNANDDATVNITDGIYILNFLFLGGPEPPAPGTGACGLDPAGSPSDLGCKTYTNC